MLNKKELDNIGLSVQIKTKEDEVAPVSKIEITLYIMAAMFYGSVYWILYCVACYELIELFGIMGGIWMFVGSIAAVLSFMLRIIMRRGV